MVAPPSAEQLAAVLRTKLTKYYQHKDRWSRTQRARCLADCIEFVLSHRSLHDIPRLLTVAHNHWLQIVSNQDLLLPNSFACLERLMIETRLET